MERHRRITLGRAIAAWLRAAAMDGDQTLTPEERRAPIHIASEVERRGSGHPTVQE